MRLPVSVPLQRAFAVLAWERAVPAFMPLVIAAAFIFALIWTGAFAQLPLAWHLAGLVLSGAVLLFLASWGSRRFRFPRRAEALRRIEERNGLKTGILDSAWATNFASAQDDPLWIASRERLIQEIGEPKAPLPRVSAAQVDRFGIRYFALLAVFAALLLTRGETDGLKASLTPPFPVQAPVVVDAWIEPPAYTELPSRILKLTAERSALGAAAGSQLHIRLRREDGRPVRGVITYTTESEGRRRIRPSGDDGSAVVVPLDAPGVLAVAAGGEQRQLDVYVSADTEPSVRLVGEPDTSTGVIRMDVITEDDYPLASGELVLSLLPGQSISRDAPMPEEKVIQSPDRVNLPSLAGQPGERQVEAGTEEHPWAGLLVKAVLRVTDGLGQTAESEPFAFTMPERMFYNPMSKAVIEERRKLAMAPGSLNRSAELFGAMVIAPDLFDVDPSEHLMLKATAEAVSTAKVRDVPDIIESLWPLALELEDDGLAYARARLDAAEEALRQALRNGADQSEIAQRIAELRQAMNDYIRALAESGFAEAEPQEGDTELGEADLDEILRRMEELAEQGANEEAESLLAQLEALLQQLQLSQGSGGQGQQQAEGQQGQGQGQPSGEGGESGQSPGEGALSGTGDLIQQQRELADETFSARRGDRGVGDLPGQQRSLGDSLRDLMEDLPEGTEGAREGYERAEETMERAARALENGNLGMAQSLQERALQQLRDAGTELAEAIGEATDEPGEGSDPLGRAFSGSEGPDPEDFGLYDPERIRELLAQIRRRLRDPDLGEAEREYLESLLERF
ncbi:DUF4175 domain-containing protein [Parvularcula lutaonensis]|uniref:DUF4175 domain-containing protein n=1 Tax=Parvularcula lutaonensis TaxID=491923 RepID=A0ABV7MGE6_9PROT|nr:DUF4175 family protein [Parvularcula lutaonensis]GGY55074.1 TIGR02302 family protein [Parvularcula lutaonensis]